MFKKLSAVLGLAMLAAAPSVYAMGDWNPTADANIKLIVHLQGAKLDGQKVFYSIYDPESKTYFSTDKGATIKKNVLIESSDVTIIIPLFHADSKTGTINLIKKYGIVFYGLKYKKYDMAVPITVQAKITGFHFGEDEYKREYWNHYAYIPSQELIFTASKDLDIQVDPPAFDPDGAVFHYYIKGGWPYQSGNPKPHKKIDYVARINLNYNLSSYVSTKNTQKPSVYKKDNFQF